MYRGLHDSDTRFLFLVLEFEVWALKIPGEYCTLEPQRFSALHVLLLAASFVRILPCLTFQGLVLARQELYHKDHTLSPGHQSSHGSTNRNEH
jgi:hypothetical protein